MPTASMTEHDLHKAVAYYLRCALSDDVPWTTFPAGGGGKARGGKLKAMGLRAGWPDIILVRPGMGRFGGIELKSDTGAVSPEQKLVHARITLAGGDVEVCRSVEDVERALRRWNIPLRASVLGLRAA